MKQGEDKMSGRERNFDRTPLNNREISELSMSSSMENNAAMEVLTKMMRDQALLAQTMAVSQKNQLQTTSEVVRLSSEKEHLAAQVVALQQQLAMTQGGLMMQPPPGMPIQPLLPPQAPYNVREGNYSSSGSVGSHRSASSHRSHRSVSSHRSHHTANSHRSHGFEQPYHMMMHSHPMMPPQPYPGMILAPNIPLDDIDGRSLGSGRSSRSRSSHLSNSSRSSHRLASSKSSKKTKKSKRRSQNGGFDPPLEEYVRPEHPKGSQFWKSFSQWMTCLVPDRCIPREGATVKQAWREKVAICMMALSLSALVVGGVGFLPIYFCRSSTKYTATELSKRQDSWTSLFGQIYIFDDTFLHPKGNDGIMNNFIKKDASSLFPRAPLAALPNFCLDMNKSEYISQFNTAQCELTEKDILEGAYCHENIIGVQTSHVTFEPWLDGQVVIPRWELEDTDMQYVLINKRIYNVTQYINALRDPQTNSISKDPKHPNAYLQEALHLTIVNKVNQDATRVFYDVFENDDYMLCLNELFFEAYLDDRFDPLCQSIGIFMYFFLFFVVGMLTIQVFCSMVYLARKHRIFLEEHLQAAVMIMVPCYNEGETELRKTIQSCLYTAYPFENKVMVIICDGCITGSGESKSTPEICAELLGFSIDLDKDDQQHFVSLGKIRDNFASVYTGTYSEDVDSKDGSETRQLKYIVVVKRGSPEERGSPRAGNRGKRDSQLILAGMFNRIHHNRQPCELDMAIVKALFSMGLPAKDIEYLMTIDADTRVEEESISHMVYAMEHDKLILACCGETQVDNKSQSLVTAMQVFEYYSSHHLKKAFESVFGCVTCLPGCFTMYRVFTDDMKCLIAGDCVYQDYSRNDVPSLHEKNLFELGEDRMLTTLLLQHFPGMRLSFVPEAICWTIVPHTFAILLSQRRRWINSTFHNMYELLKVENMCGICFLSMKTVVIMDMVVTMILPASLIYIGYLTYLLISQPETLDTFVLIFYGATFGMQMLSFLIRSRWDYIWWFAIFTVVGIPVFYFILPIYAFTHSDDFTWGKTRQIGSKEAVKADTAIANSEDSTKLDDDFDQTSTNRSTNAIREGPSRTDEEMEIHFDDTWPTQGEPKEIQLPAMETELIPQPEDVATVPTEKQPSIVVNYDTPYASSNGLPAQPVITYDHEFHFSPRDDRSVGSHRSGRSSRSQQSSKSHRSSTNPAAGRVKYQAMM